MEKSVGSLASYTRGRATDYNGPFHPSAAPSALLSLPPPCLPPPISSPLPFSFPPPALPALPPFSNFRLRLSAIAD